MANGINTAGFKGSVNDVRWARLIPRAGSAPYGVVKVGDCKVTAAAGDRAVSVAGTGTDGGCWGWGVFCEFNASTTLTLTAPTTGSRWDLIALRRDWNTRTVTPIVIPGSASRDIPGARKQGPGVLDDQPLALVRVTAGSSAVAEIVDLRCWAGQTIVAADTLALNFLDYLGTSVRVGAVTYDRVLDAKGAEVWARTTAGGAIGYVRQSGFREPPGNGGNICEIAIPDPGFPYHIHADATVEAGGGGSGTRWNLTLVINGAGVSAARGDAVAPWFQMSGGSWAPANSSSVVAINASRMFGSGPLGVSSFNQYFSVQIYPAL